MSRILLLLLFVIWMTWRQSAAVPNEPIDWGALSTFIAGFIALVLLMGLWSRLIARHIHGQNLYKSLARFNRSMFVSRLLIPIWLAAGLYTLGWGNIVLTLLGRAGDLSINTPGAILGTLPALAAWVSLWWSQYPADRALREQSVLAQLERDLPIYAPPPFVSYFTANLRLQLLFTVVPVLLLLLAHDVVTLTILRPLRLSSDNSPMLALALMLTAAGLIYIIAPEVLRHILQTNPLKDSPLRRRLEALCRKHNLKYRDILLWQTNASMGNAAVMGVIPRFRYILLSDLLLETMSDAQIEAVFAHELGHIVHRHMWWYLVFILIFLFTVAGPGEWIADLMSLPWIASGVMELFWTGVSVGGFLLTFGYISRRFERQADVFAARTIQSQSDHATAAAPPAAVSPSIAPSDSTPTPAAANPVGPLGTSIFSSALYRVAAINNIPASAPSWCHGSIRSRMDYLGALSQDAASTARFDLFMKRLYLVLILALAITATWTILAINRM